MNISILSLPVDTKSLPLFPHREATKKRFFGQFDKDHDGKVNHDELQQAMSECGIEWSDDETARAMELLDKDDSGSINCAELITLLYGDQEADD